MVTLTRTSTGAVPLSNCLQTGVLVGWVGVETSGFAAVVADGLLSGEFCEGEGEAADGASLMGEAVAGVVGVGAVGVGTTGVGGVAAGAEGVGCVAAGAGAGAGGVARAVP